MDNSPIEIENDHFIGEFFAKTLGYDDPATRVSGVISIPDRARFLRVCTTPSGSRYIKWIPCDCGVCQAGGSCRP